MAEPRLIQHYLTEIARELPRSVVEELADGLDQAYYSHLAQGLPPDGAAQAAVIEFGEPQVVAAAFAAACPARRSARRLLAAGPGVGACWGIALITAKAWTWPVPAAGRVMFGMSLLSVIALLIFASLGRRYRPVRSCAITGLAGVCLLDASLLATVVSLAGAISLPMVVAAAASLLRMTYAARTFASSAS